MLWRTHFSIGNKWFINPAKQLEFEKESNRTRCHIFQEQFFSLDLYNNKREILIIWKNIFCVYCYQNANASTWIKWKKINENYFVEYGFTYYAEPRNEMNLSMI